MDFDLKKSIEILESTPQVLKALLTGLSSEWIRSNEGKNTWSPYNVVGHLIYGEKTDWLVRTKIIISTSENKPFEPFDRFAQISEDQKRPIRELLDEYEELRNNNLKELQSFKVDQKHLDQIGVHPEFGEVNLRQLLSAWVVHDLGHLAQIARVMAKQYKDEVGPWVQYLSILQR